MKTVKWTHSIAVLALVIAAGFAFANGNVQATASTQAAKAAVHQASPVVTNGFANSYAQSTHHTSLN